MKIQIHHGDKGATSIRINDKEMGNCISEFTLKQRAGEAPELILTVPLTGDMDTEIPDGAVFIRTEQLE